MDRSRFTVPRAKSKPIRQKSAPHINGVGPRIPSQRNGSAASSPNKKQDGSLSGSLSEALSPASVSSGRTRFSPLSRSNSVSTLDAFVGGAQGLDEETRLRWHIMKGELQELLGNQYKQLSIGNVGKLIRWKMAGPGLYGIDRPVDEFESVLAHPRGLNPLRKYCQPETDEPKTPESVLEAPDEFVDESFRVDGERMSHVSNIKLEEFELQITSLSGEVLAVLDDVRASWSRTDILDALSKQSPLQSSSFYKLSYNDTLLNGERTLADCDHKIVHRGYYVRPSVVAVVLPNPERLEAVLALEAILALEPHLITVVASIKAPPPCLLLTAQALGSLFDFTPVQVRVGEGRVVPDYWTPAQRTFFWAQQTFFKDKDALTSRLKSFDMDSNPMATIEKLVPFISDVALNIEEIGKASLCCKRIAQWCHSVYRHSQAIS